ncbi:MAG: hypothetical protein Q4D79_07155 [Propionibacteriaceae bacterium]|nr:hypothetical protein [Propionibacteriaceae bacterium]
MKRSPGLVMLALVAWVMTMWGPLALSARAGGQAPEVLPSEVTGTPVQGAQEVADAPVLALGQYTDVSQASSSGKVLRYYRIQRQWPGSTLRVNAVAYLPGGTAGESYDVGAWNFELATSGGTRCSHLTDYNKNGRGTGTIVSATLVSFQLDPKATKPGADAEACASATELVYKIERGAGTGGETPIEIRVIEEPPAENAAELPTGVSEVPKNISSSVESPASGTPEPMTGGSSFNDAATVGPGTFTAEVTPGQKMFFKTRLDYGQQAVFAVDAVRLKDEVREGMFLELLNVASDVYAPDLSQMNSDGTGSPEMLMVSKTEGVEMPHPLANQVPEIRFRNRWDSPRMFSDRSAGFSMAGYYYFVIGVGGSAKLGDQPVSLDFSFGTEGEPASWPTSTVAPEAGGEDDPTSPAGGMKRTLYFVGGMLVVLGGAGCIAALRLRAVRAREAAAEGTTVVSPRRSQGQSHRTS